jgi:hypothetical protein
MASMILSTIDITKVFQRYGRHVPTSPVLIIITARRNGYHITLSHTFKEKAERIHEEEFRGMRNLLKASERDLQAITQKEEPNLDKDMDYSKKLDEEMELNTLLDYG